MRIEVNPNFIHKVASSWDDETTQEMIEAMVSELKKDCREKLRRCSGREAQEWQAWYEELMGQVQNEDFWGQMDHLLDFYFEY